MSADDSDTVNFHSPVSSDILKPVCASDELFGFVSEFVDTLPKTYNTVSVALSRIGEVGDIDVVGNVVGIPDARPVQITKADAKDKKRLEKLENKVYQFFHLSGGSFTMVCCVHNVVGLEAEFPHGKGHDEFAKMVQKLHEAYKIGAQVNVLGKFVTFRSDNKDYRVLFVDLINIENDALTSKLSRQQFKDFMDLCQKHGVSPLDLFSSEIFVSYIADDYLKKSVALMCLSPKSREEMCHILLLSAPGEGKDYLIDKVIQPMVPCGKVESDQVTTTAALVGAMSSNDLSSLGVGILQKYNHERLAVSEIQTWNSSKFGALLGMMANGYYIVSKGKMQNVKRPATENILMAGNIPNHWRQDMEPMEKLDSVVGAKNRQHAKQLISRFSLIYARISLQKKPDPRKKAFMMLENMDNNSAIADGAFFENDENIKDVCLHSDLSNREKSRRIRAHKVEIMRSNGMTDAEIIKHLRLSIWQEFFGQYFKYVSRLNIRMKSAGDIMLRTMESLVSREEFSSILCNESGDFDPRKWQQFVNLCKSFAKINGGTTISPRDISEAENIYKESLATLVDIGADILFSYDLDMVELDILKFIGNNPMCTDGDIRAHLKMSASDEMYVRNIENLTAKGYVTDTAGKYAIEMTKLPPKLMDDLHITRTTIQDRDEQMHRAPMDNNDDLRTESMLESRLDEVDLDE